MDNFINSFTNFVRSIYQEDFVALHRPVFNDKEKQNLIDCIDSNFVSSAGAMIDEFEENIAEYVGSKYAVSTVNGTSALHISLLLSGVKPNTEVITQALTFVATGNAILYCNARPIFIDVDKTTLGMSSKSLKDFLINNTYIKNKKTYNKNSNSQISACVPMHTFGHSCEIDKIKDICDEFNITLVEDAAESLGTFYKGKHTGNFSKLAAISFNGNKILTTGGGGMIITNDEILAKKAKHITTTAKIPHPYEYVHDEIAYNYRMPNINAALGIAQLEKLEKFLYAKREITIKYEEFFSNFNEANFYIPIKDSQSNNWLNAIYFNNINDRNYFLNQTNAKNIMTRPIWKLLTSLDIFSNFEKDELINSRWLEDRIVNIPSSVPNEINL